MPNIGLWVEHWHKSLACMNVRQGHAAEEPALCITFLRICKGLWLAPLRSCPTCGVPQACKPSAEEHRLKKQCIGHALLRQFVPLPSRRPVMPVTHSPLVRVGHFISSFLLPLAPHSYPHQLPARAKSKIKGRFTHAISLFRRFSFFGARLTSIIHASACYTRGSFRRS